MPTDLPHFEEPPIHEVAIGFKFAAIKDLSSTHFGLFWAQLKEEFGVCREVAQLSTSDGPIFNEIGLPQSRLWLIHNDQQHLMQLQSNIFYFNWRRTSQNQDYPRFSSITPFFYDNWQRYVAFLGEVGLPQPEAVECNLTYVNNISPDQNVYSNIGSSGLFPDVNWRQLDNRYLPPPKTFDWQAIFDIDETLELTAKVQSGVSAAGNDPVLRFEIAATDLRPNSPVNETQKWFDDAHKAIVLSFADLTDPTTQHKLWKRADGAN